jgi:hypothetical protein
MASSHPPSSPPPSDTRVRVQRCLVLLAAFLIFSEFTGCGTLHGWGQVGPDLKPQLGTSVSVPLGGR